MTYTTFVIARNTYRECVRQPIFFILTMVTLIIIGTYPAMTGFVFREQEKLVRDGALASILFFGWITAVLCASHAIAREIETGTVLLVLSKPVKRGSFIVAKVLGILGALMVFLWVNSIATLIALRVAKDQFRIDMNIFYSFFGAIALACIFAAGADYMRGEGSTIKGSQNLSAPMRVFYGIIHVFLRLAGSVASAMRGRSAFPSVAVHSLIVTITLVGIGVFLLPPNDYGYQWTPYHPGGFSGNLARALAMIAIAVCAMGVLATILSTRLNLVTNFIVCGVIFLIGAVNSWFTDRIRAMSYENVVDSLTFSHYLIAPMILVLWFASAKAYHHRQNKRLSAGELHLAFGVLTSAAVSLGVFAWKMRLDEMAPSPLVTRLASVLFEVKNGIVWVVHRAAPDWQLFFYADALASGATIPIYQIFLGLVYLVLFSIMTITIGMAMFAGREVGQQVQQG